MSSRINNATNSVIHQKNRLNKNHSQKLRPLLLAIVAGKNATKTHKNKINVNHMALSVAPKIVIANMLIPSLLRICLHYVINGTQIPYPVSRFSLEERKADRHDAIFIFVGLRIKPTKTLYCISFGFSIR